MFKLQTEAPSIDLEDQTSLTFTAKSGSNLMARVRVKGSPRPTFTWVDQNGRLLESSNRVAFENVDDYNIMTIKGRLLASVLSYNLCTKTKCDVMKYRSIF